MIDPVFTLGTTEVVLRLAAAAAAGSAIGLNRELKGKSAGLRTHALITLGAALATLAVEGRAEPHTDALSRVIQGIITGVGFAGAGVILRDEANRRVRGLTTAATIWVAAAIGVCCGLGYWYVTLIAMALILTVLMLGGPIERLTARRLARGEDDESAEI